MPSEDRQGVHWTSSLRPPPEQWPSKYWSASQMFVQGTQLTASLLLSPAHMP